MFGRLLKYHQCECLSYNIGWCHNAWLLIIHLPADSRACPLHRLHLAVTDKSPSTSVTTHFQPAVDSVLVDTAAVDGQLYVDLLPLVPAELSPCVYLAAEWTPFVTADELLGYL